VAYGGELVRLRIQGGRWALRPCGSQRRALSGQLSPEGGAVSVHAADTRQRGAEVLKHEATEPERSYTCTLPLRLWRRDPIQEAVTLHWTLLDVAMNTRSCRGFVAALQSRYNA
jgi:hypothetical protein